MTTWSTVVFTSDKTHFKLSWFVTEGHQDPGHVSRCLERTKRNSHSEPGFVFFFFLSFLPSRLPFFLSPFLPLSRLVTLLPPPLLPSIILFSLPSFWDRSSLSPSDQEIQNSCTPRHQPQTKPASLHTQSVSDQWGIIPPEQHGLHEPRLRWAPECDHPGDRQQGHRGQWILFNQAWWRTPPCQ